MARLTNILSLNVGMSSNLAGLTTLLSVNPVDLILLQEIRISDEQINATLGRLGYTAVVNIDMDSPTSPGTAVAWKNIFSEVEVFTLIKCRCQMIKLGVISFINIYAPSGSSKRHERNVFFGEDIFRALSLVPKGSFFLSGDFNCVLCPRDIENVAGFNQKQCNALKDLIFSFDLIDAFRTKWPNKEEFTFFRQGKAASRLDRFYVPSSYPGLLSIRHVPSLSDHCAIVLQVHMDVRISISERQKRSTYWKLNTAILRDDEFLPSFKSLWKDLEKSQDNMTDIAAWWDIPVKPAIKQFCVSFSQHRKLVRRYDMI